MSENPKCPYCGEEMEYQDQWVFPFYICPNCYSQSPRTTEIKRQNAAYAAAMKRERPKAKNIGTDYGEQDQFICSECGIHLQDWIRIDEDDYEDGVVHEYVFRFCPNCGKKLEEPDDEK